MGIKDFIKAFSAAVEGPVTFRLVNGMRLYIDSFVSLYSHANMQARTGLTNPRGEGTQHIISVISNIINMSENGIEMIWGIDSRQPPHEKKQTLDDRRTARETALRAAGEARAELEKMTEISRTMTPEQLRVLDPDFERTLAEKRAAIDLATSRATVGSQMNRYVSDLIRILTGLGIPYCMAPDEVESEQYGAYLCGLGMTDGIVTTDTDALAFGAPWILKKRPNETGKYDLIRLDKILSHYGLTQSQFVDACVMLGSDYAAKTPGVGPATIVRAAQGEHKLTPEQEAARARFTTGLRGTPAVIRPVRTPESIAALRAWLVDEQGFNGARLDKQFEKLKPRTR